MVLRSVDTGRGYAHGYRHGDLPLVWLTWDQFLAFMADVWAPGMHICNVGPTGEGKTTVNVGLLDTRRFVMALDPKGEDETLEASGWTRVTKIPGDHMGLWSEDRRTWNKIWQDIAEGRPARVIVGGPSDSEESDAVLLDLLRRAIAFARYSRGWTLYVDEFELLSSQRQGNLGRYIERMLISARRARTSVVTSYQAPAWVSKHAARQARFAIQYATGSKGMIKNLAEDMGRDWRVLAEAVDELDPFYVLVIPRGKNGGPMILTTAPRVNLRYIFPGYAHIARTSACPRGHPGVAAAEVGGRRPRLAGKVVFGLVAGVPAEHGLTPGQDLVRVDAQAAPFGVDQVSAGGGLGVDAYPLPLYLDVCAADSPVGGDGLAAPLAFLLPFP